MTATPESTLTGYSDVVICIPSKTKEPWKYYTSGVLRGEYDDLTPMGTLLRTAPTSSWTAS
ncbi:MAG: 6-phospho-3-hexuloisomerase [Methanothermobacter sp.]|nr:6-phospho-3-hexuloisomerase [Methanothermobacter sp.]